MRSTIITALALTALTLLTGVAQAAPTASYTTAPAGPPWYTGEVMTFDGSASVCDVAPCTYTWADDGGDGAGGTQWPLGTGTPLNFTFQNPGTKRVRLIVRNASNQTAAVMRSHILTAGPRPTPPPPVACNDTVDNDADGLVDLADPGCTSSTDTDETDVVPPPAGTWPNPGNTGAKGTLTDRSSSLTASTAGQVIQNLRFTNGASIQVNANNVVIRNVRLEGGTINWSGNRNVLIEDTTVTSRPGTTMTQDREGVIGYGGGTLRRVQITNRAEGVRDGDSNPLTIEDSFIYVNRPPSCGDWHGDALQGYGSGGNQPLRVTNTYFELDEQGCGGTAPFFYPGRDNTGPVIADRVIVKGGGFSFRMSTPGSVTNLHIVNNEWGFGPISVKCSVVSPWTAWRSTLDANYQPTPVSSQSCNTEAPPGT